MADEKKRKGYSVPGLKPVVRQPTSNTCWAAAYCMMRSWREQAHYSIEGALKKVPSSTPPKSRYLDMFEDNKGMSPETIGPFLRDANMSHQPFASYVTERWIEMLKEHGLLWVGLSIAPGTYAKHSRIVKGIEVEGKQTYVHLLDPASNKPWEYMSIDLFHQLYYEAAQGKTSYAQIRHF